MALHARYVHTNLIANDWRSLASFYEEVFACEPLPPERDLSEEWLERATGIPGARLKGVHLKLPGYGENGPTLEIFQYQPQMKPGEPRANRPGFGHIAFSVEDVSSAYQAVLSAGGKTVGDIVSVDIKGAGRTIFVYMTDPEGNILELQQWVDDRKE